jgi:hypothetical protein
MSQLMQPSCSLSVSYATEKPDRWPSTWETGPSTLSSTRPAQVATVDRPPTREGDVSTGPGGDVRSGHWATSPFSAECLRWSGVTLRVMSIRRMDCDHVSLQSNRG